MISMIFRSLCSKRTLHFSTVKSALNLMPNSINSSFILRQQSSSNIAIRVTLTPENGNGPLVAWGKEGETLLDVVRDKDLDLDGFGACDGELACCSCHVVLHKNDFDQLPNKATDEELDMLDLAPDLTETSRLGCQIRLCGETMKNGLEVRVPSSNVDARLIDSTQNNRKI